MKRAGHLTRLTLGALEANVRVGVTTAELDAVAARVFGGAPVQKRDSWSPAALRIAAAAAKSFGTG